MVTRAKLSDVARLAGVSAATVSRVLNNNERVDPDLVSRVQRATAQLGYRQNSLARGLRRRANNMVGAVIPDITNTFFADLVRGVEDEVRKHDYLLVLCNSDETAEKEQLYLQLLVDQQVAGVVIAPVQEQGAVGITQLLAETPVVAVDRKIAAAAIDSVTLDNVSGAIELTRHLLGQSREIATIAGPAESTTGRDRLRGYRLALEEVGVALRREWVLESDFSEQGGYAAAHELFSGKERPGAIFVANNAMTVGALRARSEFGLGPRDVALGSFDPLSWSVDPGHEVAVLTVPSYEMGQTAARMLMQRIVDEGEPSVRAVQLSPGQVRG